MITIFHLDNSRSERIVWLAEELGLAYEIKTYLRVQGLAPPEYREIHPLGRAPVIRDGDLTLMESGAICDYLTLTYGATTLAPAPGSREYAWYLEWLHFAEGSAMSGALMELILQLSDAASPRAAHQHQRNAAMLTFVDSVLAERSYFAGDQFTTADIMMEFDFAFMERSLDLDRALYPNIGRWLDLVRQRPAYSRAMAVAGPQVPLPFKRG